MSTKRIQLFFIAGVIAMSLHFSFRFANEYFHFLSLSNQSPAKIRQWEIVEVKDRFGLKALYDYEVQNRICQGECVLKAPSYLNEAAALWDLKQKAKTPWSAWYNEKQPSVSSLEKNFPTSLLVKTLICYGVVIYFFCLYKKFRRV